MAGMIGATRVMQIAEIYRLLQRQNDIFADLRIEVLDRTKLKMRVDEIGRSAA
jgi:hypothetical protein